MKLGEMLIRDGRITDAQLREALAQQRQDGGRLGTVMVEMGMVDLDTLTVYLGLELGIPIATGPTLDRAKRSAVRLLSPDLAARHRCVPIMVQDRQLIAAIDDPHDMVALDDLARTTGYRIIPRVAPEIRIWYYLERYYGVIRPPRFRVFGDAPRGEVQASSQDLPAPPLPGLPPKTEAPVPAPTPPPVLVAEPRDNGGGKATPPPTPPDARPARSREDGPPPPPLWESPEEVEALEIDAADLLVELEADEDEAAQAAEETTHRARRDASSGAIPEEAATPDHYEPLALQDALMAMADAQERGAIAEAMMRYAVGVFDVVVICIVRDNLALGWLAHGGQLNRFRIETLLIPLDGTSMFQSAMVAEDPVYTDRVFPATLHRYLFKVLRCAPPEKATIGVVSIGKRIVNLIYAHKSDGSEPSEDEANGLRQVCNAATDAYVRLIAVSKSKSKSKSKKPEPKVTEAEANDDAEDPAQTVVVDEGPASDPGKAKAAKKPKKKKRKSRKKKK